MSYNGWSNYESWNVGLWLGESADALWSDRAAELLQDNDGDKHATTVALADEIEAEIMDGNPLAGESSTYADLLGAALRAVNFYEVAEGFVEVALEDNEGDDDPDDDPDDDDGPSYALAA